MHAVRVADVNSAEVTYPYVKRTVSDFVAILWNVHVNFAEKTAKPNSMGVLISDEWHRVWLREFDFEIE